MTNFDEVVSPGDQRPMILRANAIGFLYVAAREEYLDGGEFTRDRLDQTIAVASTVLDRDEITQTINMAREED